MVMGMAGWVGVLGCSAVVLAMAAVPATAPRGTNSEESKVGPYTLPDALTCADGTKVADARAWREKRRPEVLELFRTHMHGRSPARPAEMRFEVTGTDPKALGGLATRKEVTIRLSADADAPPIHVLLYVPNGKTGPVPAFVGVNFDGNHAVDADASLTIHEQWEWDGKAKRELTTRPADATRGKSASSWQVEMLMKRGYALATIPRHGVEPDYAEGWRHGVRGYYLKKAGKTEFAADDWGAIAAWGWSLSRALDYLETDKDIDAKRVAVVGHSRMGKAALWAGAEDERFAIVISNDSGEGGASLARRWFGETTAVLNRNFPHWFCGNFKQYSDREDALPFDAHELVALAAPRPVYVASADGDKWADPKGEFLAAKHAGAVYQLFGKGGVGADEMPGIHKPVGDAVGYHLRQGPHNITAYDWEQYLAFADRHFARK